MMYFKINLNHFCNKSNYKKGIIPFLKKSYAKNQYFNTCLTPLKKWNAASGFYCKSGNCNLTRLYSKAGVTYFSNSDGVSLLKTVTKKLVLDALRGEKEIKDFYDFHIEVTC